MSSDDTSGPTGEADDWAAYLALHAPSPELQAMFTKVDAFLAGLTRAEGMAAARAMYFDGDGELRRHDQVLRLVRDDEVTGSATETRPEDQARGERVTPDPIDLARRRADRANGVVDLRDGHLRRGRRRGQPPPD